jgi:hypothetical protein
VSRGCLPCCYFDITMLFEARPVFLRKRKGYFSPASFVRFLAIVVLRPKQKYMRSNLQILTAVLLRPSRAFPV